MEIPPLRGDQGGCNILKKNKILPYNSKLKERARQLRKSGNLSEVLLWQQIKKKQIDGYTFLRQKPLGSYIVDFFCKELMLAVEIDGDSHDRKIKSDRARQNRLEVFGIRFLRFQDRDVKRNLEGVLVRIRECVREIERERGTP